MKKLKRLLGILIAISFASLSTGCEEKSDSSVLEGSDNSAELLSNIETSEYFSEFNLNTDYNDITAQITLSDNETEISGSGAEFKDNKVSVTSGGTFLFSGSLTDGQIYVNAADENVHLVFDSVSITNSTSSPVFIEDVKNVSVTLTDGSKNILTDSENYVFSDTEENEPDSVIFSKDDLSINGNGSLTINANYNEGITSKNDLRIAGGDITITSAGNAVKGKDSVAIKSASINITSGEDGIKASNSEETDKGYIYLESGTFNITAQNDAIQAEKYLTVNDGKYNLKTGDGSDSVNTDSHQMLQKPNGENGDFVRPQMPDGENGDFVRPQMPDGENGNFERLQMPTDENGDFERSQMSTDENGDFERPQMPDGENGNFERPQMPNGENEATQTSDEETESQKGFKSASVITINGGTIKADCSDDSIHAGSSIEINGGTIDLSTGDDGIHSDKTVNIKNGNITINKSYEGIEGIEINIDGGDINIHSSDDGLNASTGTTGSDPMASSPECNINLNGGNLYVNADGDGIDSNGTITINNGNIIVDGTESGADSVLDSGIDVIINGGNLITAGSSGMLEVPDSDSRQNTIVAVLDNQQSANTQISLTDENGNSLISHIPSKNYSAVIISSPDIKTGSEYSLITGSSNESSEILEKFTISEVITTIGNISDNNFGGRGNKGGMPNGNEFDPRMKEQNLNDDTQSEV